MDQTISKPLFQKCSLTTEVVPNFASIVNFVQVRMDITAETQSEVKSRLAHVGFFGAKKNFYITFFAAWGNLSKHRLRTKKQNLKLNTIDKERQTERN